MRVPLSAGLLLILPLLAGADEPDLTVRLTVPPAAAPTPALRYPLLPELRETTPGNAALLYYRSFSPEWSTHRRPEVSKVLDQWRGDTSKQPPDELRWVLSSRALQEVDRAARRTYCDWEMTERLRKDGLSLLLPDVQGMREFASLLALRARFQMQAGEHDRVLYTIQTGLMLGRHTAEGPTLIQSLVGIAVSMVALEEVQRWIQQPGSPNLYWSLTNLPVPFIDLRKPLQGERIMIDSLLGGLREAMRERRPDLFSPEKVRQALHELGLVEGGLRLPRDEGVGTLIGKLGMAGYAAKVYPQAREVLHKQGWTAKELDALPVTTAAVMLEVHNYDRIYDELLKWYGLPYPVARPGLRAAEKELRQSVGNLSIGSTLARLLLPAVEKVMQAGVRIDRKIAVLRNVEALRLYAAAHDGKLPAQLEDIREVPLPLDPVTGKPFEYRRIGDRARLNGPPPAGEMASRNNSLTIEITIKK